MMTAAEYFETGSKKPRGRGMAQKSLDLVQAMVEIAEAVQPVTGRGIGYKLFTAGLIPSMSTLEMQRVYRLLKGARERGQIPWEWVVDETRSLDGKRPGPIQKLLRTQPRNNTGEIFGTSSRCAARSGQRRERFAACWRRFLTRTALGSGSCTASAAQRPSTKSHKTMTAALSLRFTSATVTPAACGCRSATFPPA